MGNQQSDIVSATSIGAPCYEVRAVFKRLSSTTKQLGGSRAFAHENGQKYDRQEEESKMRVADEAREAYERERDTKPAGTEGDPEEAIDLDPDQDVVLEEDDELNELLFEEDLDAIEGEADRAAVGSNRKLGEETVETHRAHEPKENINPHKLPADEEESSPRVRHRDRLTHRRGDDSSSPKEDRRADGKEYKRDGDHRTAEPYSDNERYYDDEKTNAEEERGNEQYGGDSSHSSSVLDLVSSSSPYAHGKSIGRQLSSSAIALPVTETY
jgi:hypothetical protein